MRSDCVVFCGPTISPNVARGYLPEAAFPGPAAAGDIYRAVVAGARQIGLIDGYFHHRLSVWHKELLWALSRGVELWGASSMGALRAAELHSFGMCGIGDVFAQFAGGVLEDDDEVAIVHEDADRDYRSRSVALVDLRASLRKAIGAGVVTNAHAQRAIAELKALHYPERNWEALERQLTPLGVASAALDEHRISVKHEDALLLLRTLATRDSEHQSQTEPWPGPFEPTEAWVQFERAQAPKPHAPSRPGADAPAPGSEDFRRTALFRALCLALGKSHARLTTADVQNVADQVRTTLGLESAEATDAWLRSQGLDLQAFSQLMHEEALISASHSTAQEHAEHQQRVMGVLLGRHAWRK